MEKSMSAGVCVCVCVWPIYTNRHLILLCSFFASKVVAEPLFWTAAILDLGNLRVLVYPIIHVSIHVVKECKIDTTFAFVSHLVQKLWPNSF